jgi:L-ribulose-5-phosphate 3-epimerase
MFRLAVFTDEVSQDLERAVAFAKEFDLQGVEIRSVWDCPPQKLTDTQITDIAKLLSENNLEVCAIASPFLKSDIFDEAATQEQYDVLDRCIMLAKRLGTPFVRGFTFWRTDDKPEVWDEAERIYRSILPKLEREDITIVVENEPDTSAATAALTARFLERLNHPCVRSVWDPANEVFAIGGERPFPDAYRRALPYMVHVHVKDAIHDAQGKPRCVRVGEGDSDWPAHLQAFADVGYQGWLSLETHWRLAADLDDDLIQRPGGEAYSASAEDATRLCMISLKEMLKQIR